MVVCDFPVGRHVPGRRRVAGSQEGWAQGGIMTGSGSGGRTRERSAEKHDSKCVEQLSDRGILGFGHRTHHQAPERDAKQSGASAESCAPHPPRRPAAINTSRNLPRPSANRHTIAPNADSVQPPRIGQAGQGSLPNCHHGRKRHSHEGRRPTARDHCRGQPKEILLLARIDASPSDPCASPSARRQPKATRTINPNESRSSKAAASVEAIATPYETQT